MPVLTQKDIEAIQMARHNHVDFIALSFVRTAQDVLDLKKVLEENEVSARVISKIETRIALENLDEIIDSSDGIMVARGDLGIEIPMEQVPYYQKLMIKKCVEQGIPVITATQMLLSMAEKPYPTRAEVSDIANAVYDLTDTLMLSEESAMGQYPEKAVSMMAKTAEYCEQQDLLEDTRTIFSHEIIDVEEMLCDTAYNLYLQFLKKKEPFGGFIVFSQTGRTARKLSAYRPRVPIFTFTPDETVKGGLTMSFAVMPFVQPKLYETNRDVRPEDMKGAFDYLEKRELIDPGKNYVLLYGDNWRVAGSVSTIKVIPSKK
jgi:pyruvate kinase